LLNLESVKVAAQYFASVEDRLDILVNNAGIMNAPFKITDDGYESQWQANYVAPHVFTAGLLDLMLATAAGVQGDKTRVRIVNVASDLAFYGPKSINFDDPNMSPGKCEGIFDPQRRYSHSKQALLRETAEITERYASQGVTAYSLHPGIVKSGLQDSNPNVLGSFTRTFVRFSGTTTLEAAYNSLFAATSPQAPEYAGKYLKPVGKLDTRCEAWVSDKETNRKLWEVTERRTKQMPLRTS
jgi:NAD(P)-dependent dehydrogenase (short-subunit alcohol dehydrogenase family)